MAVSYMQAMRKVAKDGATMLLGSLGQPANRIALLEVGFDEEDASSVGWEVEACAEITPQAASEQAHMDPCCGSLQLYVVVSAVHPEVHSQAGALGTYTDPCCAFLK